MNNAEGTYEKSIIPLYLKKNKLNDCSGKRCIECIGKL